MGKIRLQDIADSLGVSLSTVSRALEGNKKISEKTRNAILDKAKELGYDPPSVIRVHRKTDPVNIAVLCPFDIFFETVIEGMKAAIAELNLSNVNVDYRFFDTYDIVEQTKQLREITHDDSFHGVAIAPAHPMMLNPLIGELVEKGKKVITFNTDAPQSSRTHYVGQNAHMASSIAAQLCGAQLRPGEDIAIVNSFSPTMGLRERTEGFTGFIGENYPYLNVLGPFEFNDTIEAAKNVAEQVILMNKDIRAIYSNNMVGTIGCARAIEKTGNSGKIFVVGFDGNDEIERYVQDGIIFATVLQEPYNQGYQAIRILLKWLVYDINTEQKCFYMKSDLLMKSTLAILKHSNQSRNALVI